MTLFTTSRPTISVKSLSRFPARVTADTGLAVSVQNGTYNFGFDFEGLNTNTSIATPADWTTLVYNTQTEQYEQVRLDALVDYTIAPRRGVGNTDATIATADKYVALTASLTAPRVWTLPAANSLTGGASVIIQDEAGGISNTNTMTIQRAGLDTVNGASSIVLNTAYDGAVFYSDGVSKWTFLRKVSGFVAASGKTLTASNTLTLTGTDGSSVAFGAGGTVAYTANKLSAFAATTSAELAGVISDETGSGALVFGTGPTITSPTLVTPALGTPSGGTLTNCSGLPVSTGISGLGSGVATAAANGVNVTGGFITYATYQPATGKVLTVSNSLTLAGTDSTTMTFPAESSSIGYRNIPLTGGAAKTGNYTGVLADSGKLVIMDGSSLTFTIPANGSVAYEVGTVLTIINANASSLTIAITTDTMTLAGTTTTGSRTLARNGMATAVKITSTSWLISGAGLT